MNPHELPPRMAAVVAALKLPVLGYQPGGYLTHPCPHCGRKLLTSLRMLTRWAEQKQIPKCGGAGCERPKPTRKPTNHRHSLRWEPIRQAKFTNTQESKPCT